LENDSNTCQIKLVPVAFDFLSAYLQDGATPLHYAVQVGALQTVKLLIKYKVDVNVADVVS
jgi:ankyrin repeat protein